MNGAAMLVALPLLAAFLTPSIGRVSVAAARLLGPVVLLYCIWLVAALWGQALPASVAIGNFAPPLGINLYLDPLSLLFALAVYVLILLAWPWSDASPGQAALLMLLAGSTAALALSGDLFNIFVFYELMSAASFGLIIVRGERTAHLATLRYLVLSGLGTVLFLLGVALVYFHTGTLNLAQLAQMAPERLTGAQGLAAFVLILLGVGVKAELFPVNGWVPEVYAAAPRWLSGLLAGLVSKLAVLALLRMLVLIFDSEQAHAVLLVLGLAGFATGELAAWWARDFVRMLSFSSIGQLGLVFVGFGIGGAAGVMAGIAVALHHMLVKPALFYLAESWGGSLERLQGEARRAPLAAALFVLLALSLVGVPPLPGFWAKLLVVMGLGAKGTALAWTTLAGILLITVVEAGYLFRLVGRFYSKGEPAHAAPQLHGWDFTRALLFGGALVACAVWVTPLGHWLDGASRMAADVPRYIATVLGQGGRP